MILDRIKNDRLTARKMKDSVRAKLLSTLLGEIENLLKKPNKQSEDELIISICKKFMSNMDIAIEASTNDEQIAELEIEKEILSKYLPAQLTAEQIEHIVHIYEPKNVGQAMQILKEMYAGQYDGKMASQVIKDYLNK